jgi:hypothetical protein
MKKNFVPYDPALELKELGFNEFCFAKYFQQDGNTPFIQIGESEIEEAESAGDDDVTFECDAPLYQQAFSFFREKYGLFVSPNVISYEDGPYLWFFEINSTVLPFGTDLGETDDYKTYEEAELECIKKLIEIAKEN